jgi:hypothetical protein
MILGVGDYEGGASVTDRAEAAVRCVKRCGGLAETEQVARELRLPTWSHARRLLVEAERAGRVRRMGERWAAA